MSRRTGLVFLIALLAVGAAIAGCESARNSAPTAPPATPAPPEVPISAVPAGSGMLPDPIRLLQEDPRVRAVEATVASKVSTGAAIAALTKDADRWQPIESTVTIVARKVWLEGKRYNGRLVWVVGAGPLWVLPTYPAAIAAVPAQVYTLVDANTGAWLGSGEAGLGVGRR